MPKISQLPVAVSVGASDLAPIVQGGVTKQATYSLISTFVGSTVVVTDANFSGQLGLNHGGTNANLTAANGAIPYSTASAFALLAPTATANQALLSGSSTAPIWSTATYPPTTTINQLLYSSSNNVIAGLATSATAVLTTSASVPTWAANLSLALGGTNASLTAANGAIPYSTASAFALLAPGSSGQLFQSGGAGAPTWTTSTYPATNAANTLLYASSANTMAALATANSSVLVTSSGGVPSLSTTLPAGLTTTDPSTAQGLATKNYVDNIATGGGQPVYAATTGALTVTQAGAGVGATLTNADAQATFALDGVNPPLNSRVLIKNQASNTQNGVYTVTNVGSGATNWILTRAIDYDTPTDINDTGIIPVENGTANGGTGWYNTTTMVLVDTTAITFVQFGQQSLSGTFTPAFSTSGTGYTSVGYSIQAGEYTKSGNVVYFTVELNVNALTAGSPTGNIIITGLPFTSSGSHPTITQYGITSGWNTLTVEVGGFISTSSTQILLIKPIGQGTVAASELTNTTSVIISGFYFTS